MAIEGNKFKLELMHRQDSGYSFITLTYFDGASSSPFSTYDEKIVEKENSQHSLTFTIAKYYEGKENPFINFIKNGRRLRLTYSKGPYDDNKRVDFIITAVSPNPTESNVYYNVTCQDVFSFDLTRQSISNSYSNIDLGVKTINLLAKEWLANTNVSSRWSVDPALENGWTPDFPSYSTEGTIRMTSSIELEENTVFQGLVEIGTLFNGDLKATYNDNGLGGVITYVNKKSSNYKGHTLRHEVNITDFSLSKDISNFASLLYVSGGEDGYGNPVGIVPTPSDSLTDELIEGYVLPEGVTDDNEWFIAPGAEELGWTRQTSQELSTLGDDWYDFFEYLITKNPLCASMLYSFDAFYDNSLMNKETYDFLNNYFQITLRNTNIMLQIFMTLYYKTTSILSNYINAEADYVAALSALTEQYNESIEPMEDGETKNSYIASNDNEREDLMQAIIDEVWNTSDTNYFNLLFSTYGESYLEDKQDEFEEKIVAAKDAIHDFETYHNEMVENYFPDLDVKYCKVPIFATELPKDNDNNIVGGAVWLKQGEIYHYPYEDTENGIYDLTTLLNFGADFDQEDEIVTYPAHISAAAEYALESSNATAKIDEIYYYQEYYNLYEALQSEEYSHYLPDEEIEFTNYLGKMNFFQALLISQWKEIYDNYAEYILEARYDDSTQISQDGLLQAAIETFATYQTETVQYSATMIDLDTILDGDTTKVQVNDNIYFYNKEISSQYSNKITIHLPLDFVSKGTVKLRNLPFVESEEIKTWSVAKVLKLEDKELYREMTLELDSIETVYEVASEFNLILVQSGKETKINGAFPVLKERRIELQITEISKDLRGNKTQLAVSENKTIDVLVERLLTSVQMR